MMTKSSAKEEPVYQKHIDVYEPSDKLPPAVQAPQPAIGQAVMHTTHEGYIAPRTAPVSPGNIVIITPPLDEDPSCKPKCAWLRLTVLLIPYHILNCIIGSLGFALALTDVIVSVCLLPILGIGICTHKFFLHMTYALSVADVLLANLVSPANDQVHILDPEVTAFLPPSTSLSAPPSVLRVSPALLRFSAHSNIAVMYYLTVKFALGMMSVVAVCLPFIPFASQAVASSTDSRTYIMGWEVHDFNFDTHPELYTLATIGLVIGGVLAMHVVAVMSRALTRSVCCEPLRPAPPQAAVQA
ncbi:hypothetical protein ATCC90586_000229 [Pythium insidiosum]|nr:hypothetical protein ATCC90586_000229 [Pythium insidiosum]